jgi:glucan 1,3-beta-glucosidase
MYQISIHNAKGVFLGVHQSESAYWQVQTTASQFNPGSWSSALFAGEPNFSWCPANDGAVSNFLNDFLTASAISWPGLCISGSEYSKS